MNPARSGFPAGTSERFAGVVGGCAVARLGVTTATAAAALCPVPTALPPCPVPGPGRPQPTALLGGLVITDLGPPQ